MEAVVMSAVTIAAFAVDVTIIAPRVAANGFKKLFFITSTSSCFS